MRDSILRLLMVISIVAACTQNEDAKDCFIAQPGDPVYELIGTSWKLQQVDNYIGIRKPNYKSILTFSNMSPTAEDFSEWIVEYDPPLRIVFIDGVAAGFWFPKSPTHVRFEWYYCVSVEDNARLVHDYGVELEIDDISFDSLVVHEDYDTDSGDIMRWYYTHASTPYLKDPGTSPYFNKNEDPGGEGSGGGSSTSYEKPEIGLESHSYTSTSLTLYYRIYNQDEAQVTSAKGYYGTSSPSKTVSATVTGSMIIIRLTGLKKNTEYYVKCSATGRGGTTVSDVSRLITNP